MSDSNDDDTLFSQDDIDKLLNSQSIEDAEESIVNKRDGGIDELSKGEDDDDIVGELSQDDIDRLLNASFDESEEESEQNSIFEEDGEATSEISQSLESEFGEDDDDLGELSQDDIERMLNASSTDGEEELLTLSEEKKDKEVGENTVQSDAFDLISQDDIDKLMATDDDLPDEEFLEPESILDEEVDEEVIDPSEAFSIENCLITQETIDNLLNEDVQEPNNVLNKEQFDSTADSSTDTAFKVNLSEDEEEPQFELDSGNEEIADSDELDALLKDAAGDMDDLLNDISQDDIDGFLKESSNQTDDLLKLNDVGDSFESGQSLEDTKSDSVRNIISQDDIDALLAGTDEEDEDILADMEMDEDLKSASSPVQNVESPLPEDDDQVILEEADEPGPTLADGTVRQIDELSDFTDEKPAKSRFVLKVILISLLFLTIMAGCVAGVYFIFFKDKVDKLLSSAQPSSGQIADDSVNVEVEPESSNINIKESKELTPGNITLGNFIVFTPARQDGITYISLDVSIDYSYSIVSDTINGRLPYYRDVIYNAINMALKSDKGDRLTESELLDIVKSALKDSLPDIKFDKVVFVNFKTG